MMNFITGKTLRQEEAKRFQERYNRREQRQLIDALSGIRAYGGNLWSWLGSLATSCVSSYFTYQNSKAELLEGLNDELWQLKKEDVMDCNDLQVRLLNASWNLLRQYKLPDEYRLTQDSLDGFFKAVNETDPEKRLRMLKARNVERNFQSYPPYWVYRAMTAQALKNDKEASECFDKFDEIWRPVLRYDPYKLEAEKYRVQALAAKENHDNNEIKKHLEIVRDYTPDDDWGNNLFAGVTYFLLGENEEGISCVEPNVDFEYEKDVSNIFLSEMKKGQLDAFALFTLQEDLKKALENSKTIQALGKRKNLTREDILNVVFKYILNNKLLFNFQFYDRKDIFCEYIDPRGNGTLKSIRFYEDSLYWSVGVFSTRGDSISYSSLRDGSYITPTYLMEELKDFSEREKLVEFLMELRELE